MRNSKPENQKSKKASPSNLREADIRAQIKDYLEWQGWFVFYHLQGLGSYPGLPDLQAVKNGRTLYIEVKRPTGRQSAHQKRFQQAVESAGGTYILARNVDDLKITDRKDRDERSKA